MRLRYAPGVFLAGMVLGWVLAAKAQASAIEAENGGH